jgi:hypothetical protein
MVGMCTLTVSMLTGANKPFPERQRPLMLTAAMNTDDGELPEALY